MTLNMTHYDALVAMPAEHYNVIVKLAQHFGYDTEVVARQVTDFTNTQKLEFPYTFFREPFKASSGRAAFVIPHTETFKEAADFRSGKSKGPKDPDEALIEEMDAEEPDEVVEAIPNNVAGKVSGEAEARRLEAIKPLIPRKNSLYVPFGNHPILFAVLKSEVFSPVYITGLSGNGKTVMVEQICAKLKRPLIRVNFTNETDEDDLIGGFRLDNGKTFFEKGPVIKAMELGAILLLDEIDLASPARVMCLQSITEGTGYFIKKTGEFIRPHKDFMIVATANTKGRGDDTAKFIATNVHNEASLERYSIVLEQDYPPARIETNILKKLFEFYEIEDEDFMNTLVKWAENIRKSYKEHATDEVISTRRLTHIVKMYAIFADRHKALALCLNRFDEHTKKTFYDLFVKLLPVPVDPHAARTPNFQTAARSTTAKATP